ncbi:hypothetical protein [Streptomyces griseomycini]|uniref:Secreted protein n=1 Tax=Streptomyces griseomycini TaxID=66895 RepID=A0A7W7PUK3_9ACTN|nr:hypothetical protein [Streptomyces griseomycini]MBB4901535.1 hypothetical protein [Streptomyces griseomycini]
MSTKRVPRHAATTVALRGVLALLVAVVGLLCLFGHAAQQRSAPSDEVSASRTVSFSSPAAAEGTKPCGVKLLVSESGAQHTGTVSPPAEASASPHTADRADASPSAFTASLLRGPAPPPPVAPFSVLRM